MGQANAVSPTSIDGSFCSLRYELGELFLYMTSWLFLGTDLLKLLHEWRPGIRKCLAHFCCIGRNSINAQHFVENTLYSYANHFGDSNIEGYYFHHSMQCSWTAMRKKTWNEHFSCSTKLPYLPIFDFRSECPAVFLSRVLPMFWGFICRWSWVGSRMHLKVIVTHSRPKRNSRRSSNVTCVFKCLMLMVIKRPCPSFGCELFSMILAVSSWHVYARFTGSTPDLVCGTLCSSDDVERLSLLLLVDVRMERYSRGLTPVHQPGRRSRSRENNDVLLKHTANTSAGQRLIKDSAAPTIINEPFTGL